MGRYPILAAAEKYLKLVEGRPSESTMRESRRLYKRMQNDFLYLLEQKRVSTTNPKKIIPEDVVKYIAYLTSGEKGTTLKDTTIKRIISQMNMLLLSCGNTAVIIARNKYPTMMPKVYRKREPSLTDKERQTILNATSEVDDSNWTRMIAYAETVLAICSGLRSKEMRLANVEDLHIQEGIICAKEVKGKGKYGEPRHVPIHPDGIPFLEKYLIARNKRLAKLGIDSKALFPVAYGANGGKYYSEGGMRELKKHVILDTGIDYDMRVCRRTYGQVLIDEGVPLAYVSLFLGHSSTQTTEEYYAGPRSNVAIAEVQELWAKREVPQAENLTAENLAEITMLLREIKSLKAQAQSASA